MILRVFFLDSSFCAGDFLRFFPDGNWTELVGLKETCAIANIGHRYCIFGGKEQYDLYRFLKEFVRSDVF